MSHVSDSPGNSETTSQTLHVRVTTRANMSMVAGWLSEARTELIIRVSAVPENGKANAALIKVLAQSLQIPKSRIEIIRGHSSRHKTLALAMDRDAFRLWRDDLPIFS